MEDLQFSASDKDDDELEEVTASSNIEVDANYDPEAEFLSYGTRKERRDTEDINDDLQVSESEEEGEIREDSTRKRHSGAGTSRDDEEDADGGIWF